MQLLIHHIKMAVRSIQRRKSTSLVIIVSLAVGLTCMNYIAAFVINEVHADSFHQNKNQIYRLLADDPFQKGEKMKYIKWDAPEIINEQYPEIQDFCRVTHGGITKIIAGQNVFVQPRIMLCASSNFLTFFTFPLSHGNPVTAIDGPGKIVLSMEKSKDFFGTENSLGKTLTVINRDDTTVYVVSGILAKQHVPSHLTFDMLIGFQANKPDGTRAYVLVNEETDIQTLQQKIEKNRSEIPIIHDGDPGRHYLQALPDIYFDYTTHKPGYEQYRNKTFVLMSGSIGLIILIVAVFNFLNLLHASYLERTKMAGIKKVLGAGTGKVTAGFGVEAVLYIFLGFMLSVLFTRAFLHHFNGLVEGRLQLRFFLNPVVILTVIAVLSLISLAGLWFFNYRIAHLHALDTISYFRNPASRNRVLPVLNTVQFTFSIILLIGVILINKQLRYAQSKDIGIDRNVYEVRIPSAYRNKVLPLKNELATYSALENVSVCMGSPVLQHALVLLHYDESDDSKTYVPALFMGDENYVRVLDIQLIEGNDFSLSPEANQGKCIVNNSLVQYLNLQNPVGMKLPGSDNEIIGVAEDFHFASLEKEIAPGYIAFKKDGSNLLVKTKRGLETEGLHAIKKACLDIIPDYPVSIETMDERFDMMHTKTSNLLSLINTFCVISILLTCIGLLALTMYSVKHKTKEIGIRKANGAKSFEIIRLFSGRFMRWITIAFLVASPAAWFIMTPWLNNFAYKTEFAWWIFALAFLITLVIAQVTIGIQSFRAAARNPVEALRYE